MTLLLLVLAGALAFANGANDNCKGIASLVSSGEAEPRRALLWAAVTTAAGVGVSALWDGGLVAAFRAGWIGGGAALPPTFFAAVLCGAIGWVLLATATGFPVSTTHSITGALVGAGLLAVGAGRIDWSALVGRFALPLAIGPLVSLATVYVAARPAAALARRSAARCACLVEEPTMALAARDALVAGRSYTLAAGTLEECGERSPALVVEAGKALRAAHWSTAGMVGFARGWNDTPKIAALALVAFPTGAEAGLVFILVAAAMAAGGLLAGRKVLATLARRVTTLPLGESLAASAVSAVLVSLASFRGFPLSTTHVTTGAIVGAGLARDPRSVRFSVVRDIALSWLVTLPVGALLALAAFAVLR